METPKPTSGFRRSFGNAFRSLLQTNAHPHVALIGGGHGLSAALAALKPMDFSLTAIVAVTDDGGSSGRLRDAFNIVPPGDLRRCLLALSDAPDPIRALFEHRFGPSDGAGLADHALGNLILTALFQKANGDFMTALEACSRLLQVEGRVLPATVEPVQLVAHLTSGQEVRGETAIASVGGRHIRRIALHPASAQPAPGVLEAIRDADIVLIGPGSLYTSVLPPLLTAGVAEILRQRTGRTTYLCNPIIERGATEGYQASDHVRVLLNHLGEGSLKRVVVQMERGEENPALLPLVKADPDNITAFGLSWVEGDLLHLRESTP